MTASLAGTQNPIVKIESGCVSSLASLQTALLSSFVTVDMSVSRPCDRRHANGFLQRAAAAYRLSFGASWCSARSVPIRKFSYALGELLITSSDLLAVPGTTQVDEEDWPAEVCTPVENSSSDSSAAPSTMLVRRYIKLTPRQLKMHFKDMIESLDVDSLKIHGSFVKLPVQFTRTKQSCDTEKDVNFNLPAAISVLNRQLNSLGVALKIIFSSSFSNCDFSSEEFLERVCEVDFVCGQTSILVISSSALQLRSHEAMYGELISIDVKTSDLLQVAIQEHLLHGIFFSKRHDPKLSTPSLLKAMRCIVEEIKAISVAFRQLALRLRDRILSRVDKRYIDDISSLVSQLGERAPGDSGQSGGPSFVLGPR